MGKCKPCEAAKLKAQKARGKSALKITLPNGAYKLTPKKNG